MSPVPEIEFGPKPKAPPPTPSAKPLASRSHRPLLVVLAVSAAVSLVYWGLFPFEFQLFDQFTNVHTLWDPGFFQTVAFEYSKLAVQYHIFPYTAPLPGYPFDTLEYPFLAGYLFYAIYLISGGSFSAYLVIIQSLNLIAEIGNAGLVFVIAKRFVSSEKRAMILAILFVVTPSMLYFTMSRYDAISTLFSLLAIYHFLTQRHKLASTWAIIGTFLRYYPAILLVLFIKHGFSNKFGKDYYRDVLVAPIALGAITLLPLLILKPGAIPHELAFSAGFGWNFESAWGVIDQFIRPTFPVFRFFYDNQAWMRVPFAVLLIGSIFLDVKDALKIVPVYAIAVIFWLNTAWLFSPEYAMWIYPLLVALSRSNKFLFWTLMFGGIMTVEIPSPFFYMFPMSQFQLVETASAVRVLVLWLLCLILLARVESSRLSGMRARVSVQYHDALKAE
jgi:hypothetical protein